MNTLIHLVLSVTLVLTVVFQPQPLGCTVSARHRPLLANRSHRQRGRAGRRLHR